MVQRTTTLYTLDKLRDLVVVEIVWPITMECSFQPKIGIMISTPTQTVQIATLVEDGGTKPVHIQF